MPKVEYVGRKSFWFGKTLPQLCLQLKNKGVGRMFCRTNREIKYPEVSYYVLTESDPDTSSSSLTAGKFIGYEVFRGEMLGLKEVPSAHKSDWRLVSKQEEEFYRSKTLPEGMSYKEPKEIPKFVPFPPLLQAMLTEEFKAAGINEIPLMPLLTKANQEKKCQ